MKRCSRCILPENYPGIRFSSDGVCNVCEDHAARWDHFDFERGRKELEQLFSRIRGRSGKYDAIVPFSGGRDSSYVLLLAQKDFGLRVLAVTFNNGFLSETAHENIRNALERLPVDHFMYTIRLPLLRKVYSIFLRRAGEFCTPCNIGIAAAVYQAAIRWKVPFVLGGTSPRTDEKSDFRICHTSFHYFAKVLRDEISDEEISEFYSPDRQSLLDMIASRFGKVCRRHITMASYVDWKEEEIYSRLASELGWKQAEGTIDHGDCLVAPVKDYLRLQRLGFSPKTQKLAALIRDGQVMREEALRIVAEQDAKTPERAIQTLMQKTGVDRSTIDEAKNKSHLDFVTHEEILKCRQGGIVERAVFGLYRKLK